MPRIRSTAAGFLVGSLLLFAVPGVVRAQEDPQADSAELRVATYNVEDVRTEDLKNPDNERLQQTAAAIQSLRPDVLLLNEISYNGPNPPSGGNAELFVENFLSVSQGEGLAPIRYQTFVAPSNTGIASGYDLDNSGEAITEYPEPPPEEQTPQARAYGNDAWGFGTFPGQYAMALLVREDLEILRREVRTFRKFRWAEMPGALLPEDFYSPAERAELRLSSKSHWDVPVRLVSGEVLHVLASHPTPPAFDGPEERNARRNHDEIRFWDDYVDDASYIVDDNGRRGGLPPQSPFVILGDLNADPNEGDSFEDPIELLLSNERVNGRFIPRAKDPDPELDADDTALFELRADYVLPSSSLQILDGGILGHSSLFAGDPPSDHFPVWLDLLVPAPDTQPLPTTGGPPLLFLIPLAVLSPVCMISIPVGVVLRNSRSPADRHQGRPTQ